MLVGFIRDAGRRGSIRQTLYCLRGVRVIHRHQIGPEGSPSAIPAYFVDADFEPRLVFRALGFGLNN